MRIPGVPGSSDRGRGRAHGLSASKLLRYMVTEDPKWNTLTADVSASLQQATEKTTADVDSTNPDLSRFRARGNKLIMYHGWNDPAISPWNSIAYYKQVQKAVGEKETAGFMQLYMVPGMEHCAGGPGPASFWTTWHCHHGRSQIRSIRCVGRLGRERRPQRKNNRYQIFFRFKGPHDQASVPISAISKVQGNRRHQRCC